jgi:hypothetical protein
MGMAKQMWLEQMEQDHEEARAQWIREQLDDGDADESHSQWDDLAEQYDTQQREAYFDYDDEWNVAGKSRRELFDESMSAVMEMLSVNITDQTRKNLYVMLHAHVVAAVEAFLSSTFIKTVLSSDTYIQKLVESDPEFAERKFTLKEIFAKQASLRSEISVYLRDLIFHNLAKVKPMYMDVFGIDFGVTKWLFKAIMVRHDCVHRAGYDKNGDQVSLTTQSIKDLIAQCTTLVHRVDKEIHALPRPAPVTPDF